MQLYNLKDPSEQVNFAKAIRQGLGRKQGLFFMQNIPVLSNMDELLELDFVTRSSKILHTLLKDEFNEEQILSMVKNAFTFDAPLKKITNNTYALELFHGPTLAFKDFGARFMAQALSAVAANEKITILTATSGDTGAAVAHAFYGIENIKVVILYPKGKISPLQEKLFCTLGENISTIAIDGDFDDCQALVKQAFDKPDLRRKIGLNSANSINISRLIAQVCYYFEAIAQLPKSARKESVVAVPCGNFGNLTAGLIAKSMGLPIKRFISATNANDTVPRYLKNNKWEPHPTIATLSNAMDVSQPNNWPRILNLIENRYIDIKDLTAMAGSDSISCQAIKELDKLNYISEPHAAIAFNSLQTNLNKNETGIFLATAHPAKFVESVNSILNKDIELPATLSKYANQKLLSINLDTNFNTLQDFLLKIQD